MGWCRMLRIIGQGGSSNGGENRAKHRLWLVGLGGKVFCISQQWYAWEDTMHSSNILSLRGPRYCFNHCRDSPVSFNSCTIIMSRADFSRFMRHNAVNALEFYYFHKIHYPDSIIILPLNLWIVNLLHTVISYPPVVKFIFEVHQQQQYKQLPQVRIRWVSTATNVVIRLLSSQYFPHLICDIVQLANSP